MLTQITKYLIFKKGFKSHVFLACKKVLAISCVAGIVMITNTPLVFAYEAHTVNVTAKIVNDLPGINPPGGEFCADGRLEVELSVSLADADIYYTTNGDDPVCGGNIYSEPFGLSDGITLVKAVACHEELRNGQPITLQSAVMAEEFDGSTPSVSVAINDYEYFCADRDAMIWHCNPENPNDYLIEWTVENYRGAASELDIDIVYIIDNGKTEDGGIVGEIDDKDQRFDNLPGTGDLTGEETSYQFTLSENYCYYGYGWIKIIATESDGCGGFSISNKIFDPMVCDSCNTPVSSDISTISSADPTDIDIEVEVEPVNEENGENENIDNNANNETATDDDSSDNDINKNTDDINTNNDVSETNENIDNPDNEEKSVNNSEDSVLKDDGIIMDREEDFGEEENNNSNDDGDDGDDDENIANDDTNLNNDVSNNTDDDESISDDGDSSDNAPIEEDGDFTEIEFSL